MIKGKEYHIYFHGREISKILVTSIQKNELLRAKTKGEHGRRSVVWLVA
jgi:hypothetical protein